MGPDHERRRMAHSLQRTKVDVLLRDLDIVLYWSGQARLGVYELDALLGYLAGAPTYSLMAELALNHTAHALACRRRLWVVNEKRIVEQARLFDLHARFVDVPMSLPELLAWVDGRRAAIGRA